MYKIYRIVDNTNDNIYIGRTTQLLRQRLAEHTYCGRCSSRDIIKNGDYRIELIEETHDKMRERYWILNTECVNKAIPGRTKKEWRQDNIHLNKDWQAKYDKTRYIWFSSMGGRPWHNNMSLLKIDPNLFS